MKLRKRLEKVMTLVALLLLLAAVGCPVYELFGIVCPCCGATRAWLSFFRGDLPGALRFHFFFWLIPALVLLFLAHDRFKGVWQRRTDIALYFGGAVLFVYNCLRWMDLVASP